MGIILVKNHTDQENHHLKARAAWAKERLSLQLTLNQREQELEKCHADLRAERERRGGLAGAMTERERERERDESSNAKSINYGMKYGHRKNLHENQLKMIHKKLTFLL